MVGTIGTLSNEQQEYVGFLLKFDFLLHGISQEKLKHLVDQDLKHNGVLAANRANDLLSTISELSSGGSNKMKELKNISGIDFEKDNGIRDEVYNLRYGGRGPTNFKQELLMKYFGADFWDSPRNVLEIGCGWGRNAQFFKNMDNVKYFGFDTSNVSLKYFKDQLSESRFYTANGIDNTILEQKYDLIYSTFVLQHIGFYRSQTDDTHDVDSITKTILPCLKPGGFFVAYELHIGQNNWEPGRWLINNFDTNEYETYRFQSSPLEGSDEHDLHDLIVIRKK